MIPIILSGGGGTRLWPLSRSHFPKQYWALMSEKTLLQETVLRVSATSLFQAPVVICNSEHRFLVAEQLRAINLTPSHIVLEAKSYNTAPAIAIACLLQENLDELLLVLPADHAIQRVDSFQTAVTAAKTAAEQDKIVTFGIKPNRPETRYGYIKRGAKLPCSPKIFHIEQFVEKPNVESASRFLKTEQYYWNSGIYLFKARKMLAELERLHPKMVADCRAALEKSTNDLDFLRLDPNAIHTDPALSIDYAVMEHTKDAAVLPVDMEWSDIGSWDALWNISPKDAEGNVTIGDVVTQKVHNSYLRSENQLLSILGLDNITVVATRDAILVAHQDYVEHVKEIVHKLKQTNRQELESHIRVYRPWGYYQTIDAGERFQVKQLMIKPNAKTSTQIHYHRAEHWVVVKGIAKVTRGDETLFVHENESVYLPMGVKHRVENPGKIPLHFIEVQSGAYLGEDDIVRLDDAYGRVEATTVIEE